MSDNSSKEKKVEDLIGDEISARLHSGTDHQPIELEDGFYSMFFSLKDAAALRDWLNQVLA